MKKILMVLSMMVLNGCGGFGDPKTASGFCVTGAGWNGSPTTAVGCNREKGNTGGGISVTCGQYTVVCNDIEKGSGTTIPAITGATK